MFDETLLKRCFQHQPLGPRLSEFQWLVIEETAPAAPSAGRRALRNLYENRSRDLSVVDPHAGSHLGLVLKALFGPLLGRGRTGTPTSMTGGPSPVPWIHVATDDLFTRRKAVPSADTLNWRDVSHSDDDGEAIEIERPLQLNLYDEAEAYLCGFDQAWWARIETARGTSLYETPVEHFLVRAALSDGMDQFMAHMTRSKLRSA